MFTLGAQYARAAQVGCSPGSTVAFPNGIADSLRGVAYIARPDGITEAVDLRTGVARWATVDSGRPLVTDGRSVVSVRGRPDVSGRISIHVMNVETGTRSRPPLPVNLPNWVPADTMPGSDARLGGPSLRLSPCLHGDTLVLYWRAQGVYASAALPTPAGAAAARRAGRGTLVVNLATGATTEAVDTSERTVSDTTEAAMAHTDVLELYAREFMHSRSTWTAGAATALLVADSTAGSPELVLETKRPVETARRTIIAPLASARRSAPTVSGDGRFVIVRQSDTGDVRVYNVENGSIIAHLATSASADAVSVFGGDAYLVSDCGQPTPSTCTLRRFDLSAGRQLWSRLVALVPRARHPELRP